MQGMQGMRALAFFLVAAVLRADERTQKLLARLTQDAQDFQRVAPQLTGREELHQKSLAAPSKGFKIRVGKAVTEPPAEVWEERSVVSVYGFSALGRNPQNLHELRQVSAVDGHRVQDQKQAQEALAQAITATGDQRKQQSLLQLQKYKLKGAATDFGQLLLLFAGAGAERYEFAYQSSSRLEGTPALIFSYRQLDGPESLTVFDAAGKKSTRLRLEGEIWVALADYSLRRITLTAKRDAESAIRQEASVDYLPSDFGCVLPSAILHRELQQGQMTVENHFTYSAFQRFQ